MGDCSTKHEQNDSKINQSASVRIIQLSLDCTAMKVRNVQHHRQICFVLILPRSDISNWFYCPLFFAYLQFFISTIMPSYCCFHQWITLSVCTHFVFFLLPINVLSFVASHHSECVFVLYVCVYVIRQFIIIIIIIIFVYYTTDKPQL